MGSLIEHPWDYNEDGFWCMSCGNRVAGPDAEESDIPDHCRQCGFPDPEEVADYHCGPWDDEEPEGDYLDDECMLMPDGQCMLAGTEFCDWECGRLA